MHKKKFYSNMIIKLKAINWKRIDSSFVPSPIDIEHPELRELAERLKGDSENETLTNILEWQDKNIKFWYERWPLFYVMQWFLRIFGVIFFVFVLVIAVLLLFLIVHFFPTLDSFNIMLIQNIYPYFILFIYRGTNALLGAIALIAVYLPIRYRNHLREKTFREVVCDTIRLSLPVDKILKYRLAVCRDYAKLTASLFFNIYQYPELYFFTTSTHVAVGININNKIYIFDQHLPISTIDNWLINNKGAEVYISKLKRNSEGKLIEVTLSKHEFPQINTEKLTEEITKILRIKQCSQNDDINFKIKLSNHAIYYDDELTKFSLIRAIKNKLESDFCGNTDKISKVNIIQDKKDLIVEGAYNAKLFRT